MTADPSSRPTGLSYLPDITTLISVQPEATVSRTVLEAEGAKIVAFAFDAGQELTEHTATMPVFVQVLSGRVEITADGQTVDLKPNGIVHFTTRLPHAVLATEPTILTLTMLDALAS